LPILYTKETKETKKFLVRPGAKGLFFCEPEVLEFMLWHAGVPKQPEGRTPTN
jgi:hypothetical protein